LNHDDLKKIYQILEDRQKEVRQRVVDLQVQQQNETPEIFEDRKRRVYEAYVTSVTINATDGQAITGHSEDIFTNPNVPEQITSILYSTASVPQALLGLLPIDRATVFLDFTRPPLLNFRALPTLATPNESNFEVTGSTEAWVTALYTRLSKMFSDRRAPFEWLHRPGIYDVLLAIFGIPFALWVDYHVEKIINHKDWASIFSTAVYVYFFILALNLFRVLFSYTRWLFPKIEFSDQTSSPVKHRVVWGALVVGVMAAMIWDIIKALA